MNVRAARRAIRNVAGTAIPAPARFVLLALAMHADGDGEAWPSVATLSDETGHDRRTVQRALAVLESAALIVRERAGPGRVNGYRLPLVGGVTVPQVGGRHTAQRGAAH